MPPIPIVFLTPSAALPADVINLSQKCKSSLLSYLFIRIIEEDLCPDQTNKIFQSKHPNWMQSPVPRISTINTLGVETLRFITTDYSTNYVNGSVSFGSATTDIVRANYYYFPFTDAQLSDLTFYSLQEISVLVYRNIDPNSIPQDYRMAVCKRLFTNLLKTLMAEARDYFSVSVGGRSINKNNVINQFTAIIEENEKQLVEEINMLRTFNKTNRVLPILTSSYNINSSAKIA